MFLLLLPCSVSAEERVVLTIGDTTERSGSRYNEDLGFWHYLEDLADVDIEYIYMTPEEYDSALSSGNLPDLVASSSWRAGRMKAFISFLPGSDTTASDSTTLPAAVGTYFAGIITRNSATRRSITRMTI